jgi:hypothetical protein
MLHAACCMLLCTGTWLSTTASSLVQVFACSPALTIIFLPLRGSIRKPVMVDGWWLTVNVSGVYVFWCGEVVSGRLV